MFGIFGTITDPLTALGSPVGGTGPSGIVIILNSLVKFAIVVAGLYTFWNLISAGYMFMSAEGDPKAIGKAWAKIWQSLIGLLIVAGSFILAAIFGYLIFKDTGALLNPQIY